MEEKDFQRIDEMMTRSMGQFQEENRKELRQFKDEIINKFDRAIGATEDNVQHKLDLVVEGQQALSERMERFEIRLESLEGRVEGIATNLSAHRRDTEAHRKGWRVREE